MAKKQKTEFSLGEIKANTTTRRELEGYISEIVLCKYKIKQNQEAIKDILDQAKDSLGMPSKILNKLVKEDMVPGTIESEARELEEIMAIHDVVEVPRAEFD